jgi:pyruvate formate lyase activating enzyme
MTDQSVPEDAFEVMWSADTLRIAGWTTSNADDWPGRTVLTALLQGCQWSCTSCQAPQLRDPLVTGRVSWSEIRCQVIRMRGGLDGVVFAGGEPTRQDGLADAIEQVRELGVPVALHTCGGYPQRLAAVLSFVERVVLEIKAPSALYRAVTGVGASAHKAFASLRLVLDRGVELQVRTHADPAVVSADALEGLAANLTAMGVKDHRVVLIGRPAQ